MIHHVVYLHLSEPTTPAMIEEMVRASRTWLLKVPEVLAVRSGRNLDPKAQWNFFYAYEVESTEKLALVADDPFHLKFIGKFVRPHTTKEFTMTFELDPSRDLKYS